MRPSPSLNPTPGMAGVPGRCRPSLPRRPQRPDRHSAVLALGRAQPVARRRLSEVFCVPAIRSRCRARHLLSPPLLFPATALSPISRCPGHRDRARAWRYWRSELASTKVYPAAVVHPGPSGARQPEDAAPGEPEITFAHSCSSLKEGRAGGSRQAFTVVSIQSAWGLFSVRRVRGVSALDALPSN